MQKKNRPAAQWYCSVGTPQQQESNASPSHHSAAQSESSRAVGAETSEVGARCGRIGSGCMQRLGRERPSRAGSRCSGIARGMAGGLLAPSRDVMVVRELRVC